VVLIDTDCSCAFALEKASKRKVAALKTGGNRVALSIFSNRRNKEKEWIVHECRQWIDCASNNDGAEQTLLYTNSLSRSLDIAAPNGKCSNEDEIGIFNELGPPQRP